MNNQPLISIIVPCYNVEQYLETCVNSVLNQTNPNWELILVDDGSSDNTPSLCDHFSRMDTRIKVIHKKNGGLVSARNAGYEAVTGKWLTYVDGDDWISTTFCEKMQNQVCVHKDVDLIFFCALQELEGKTVEGKWNWSQYINEKIYGKSENLRLSAYSLNYNSGLSDVWAKVYRVSWCKEFDIKHNPTLRQGEESVDYVMRAFYYANKTLFLNDRLYHYRYNNNSISKRIDEKNAFYIADCMKVIKAFIDTIPDNDMFIEEFKLRNAYVMISIAMQTFFHPNNIMPYKARKMKYKNFIDSNPLFIDAIEWVKPCQFDILRKLAFLCIKYDCYRGLDFIGKMKQFALTHGFFNY